MYQSLIVVDDFYPDPMEVRRFALASDYPPVTGRRTFPGRNSAQSFIVPALDGAVTRIIGEPLEGIDDGRSSHGKFRITLAGERGRYGVHVDPTQLTWVGVIYLNTADQCRGGTVFFRHKEYGLDRAPLNEQELAACGQPSVAALLEWDGNSPDRWEPLMTVPMRFNRLILYRPWLWHSAGEPFGDTLDNGRLVQLVSFRPRGQSTI